MPTNKSYNPNIIVGLTISMSWQLALIVLLPVFGGHVLDNKIHPNGLPVYTFVGLFIALAGMIIVVRNTIRQLNKITGMNQSKDETTSASDGVHKK